MSTNPDEKRSKPIMWAEILSTPGRLIWQKLQFYAAGYSIVANYALDKKLLNYTLFYQHILFEIFLIYYTQTDVSVSSLSHICFMVSIKAAHSTVKLMFEHML